MHVPAIPRAWSRGEELANCLSHAFGFIAALVSAPWLVEAALKQGDSILLVGVIVFTLTALALYLASAWHHALPPGEAKDRFETLDHAGIFLLIAGTYTPVALSLMRGPWGWTMLALIWAIAVTGVTFRITNRLKCPRVSIALYVMMGWLALTLKPVWLNVATPGVLLLFGGGIIYTLGLVFYLARSIRYHHLVWHLFVVAGTACHYFAILWLIARGVEMRG